MRTLREEQIEEQNPVEPVGIACCCEKEKDPTLLLPFRAFISCFLLKLLMTTDFFATSANTDLLECGLTQDQERDSRK